MHLRFALVFVPHPWALISGYKKNLSFWLTLAATAVSRQYDLPIVDKKELRKIYAVA